MPYTKKQKFINDAGFTLMEIIAVLVILSILGVVAAPKYFDLQNKARERAFETAVAEGVGRVNGYFASQILDNADPNTINYTELTSNTEGENVGEDIGDFLLVIAQTAGTATSCGENANTSADNVDVVPPEGCLRIQVTAEDGTALYRDGGPNARAKFVPIPKAF